MSCAVFLQGRRATQNNNNLENGVICLIVFGSEFQRLEPV